jgi:antitoxin VapB
MAVTKQYEFLKTLEFAGVHELEIHREGDVLILRPVRPDWLSFIEVEKADADWLQERPDIISDEGRFAWL